jgi:hypothetical protein
VLFLKPDYYSAYSEFVNTYNYIHLYFSKSCEIFRGRDELPLIRLLRDGMSKTSSLPLLLRLLGG